MVSQFFLQKFKEVNQRSEDDNIIGLFLFLFFTPLSAAK